MTTKTLSKPQTRFDSFKFETEVAVHDHTYESLSYPKDAHSIGIALERILICDFSELNTPRDRRRYLSLVKVNELSFLLSLKIKMGPTEVSSGSVKLSSSIVIVVGVSLYQGIAAYPDFKAGFDLLREDVTNLVLRTYENSQEEPNDPEQQPRDFSIDLYFREERDLAEEIKRSIRRQLTE